MGVLGPASVRVRYVRPEGDQRVRLVVDQVRRQELTGRPDEETMRRLLIAAVSDPADPGVRVDSIDALKEQSGPDILRVLLTAAQTDANAGVRLKAIDGLRRFAADPQVQTVLASALEHDANPGVRSEAIAALVPYTRDGGLDPDVSQRLGQIARSGQDDYIRMQCVQVLKELKSPAPVY
jgi:HEAT repeat protein